MNKESLRRIFDAGLGAGLSADEYAPNERAAYVDDIFEAAFVAHEMVMRETQRGLLLMGEPQAVKP